ncbi:MAG: hypothetical protein KAG61_07825 [Bacteriovoracaceae bacterium]|nr:hypothetical protein [Bacteriovoracaceae bacterium]
MAKKYEAHAFLKGSSKFPKYFFYGKVDGTGTDKHKNIAIYKAVSEALERYAFYSILERSDAKRFGFDIEPTTTGLAAFPGITKIAARKISNFEAIERWALSEWWQGRLSIDSTNKKKNIIEIQTPFTESKTVVTWNYINHINLVAYGFATESSLSKASKKAKVEMSRNIEILEKISKKQLTTAELNNYNPVDLRLIYFAKEHGHKLFLDKICQSEKNIIQVERPRKIINCELTGPWSTFTTVWRTLYEQENRPHLEEVQDFFLF